MRRWWKADINGDDGEILYSKEGRRRLVMWREAPRVSQTMWRRGKTRETRATRATPKVDKDKDGKSTNKDDKKSRDSKSTTRQDKRSKSNTKDRQKGQKSDLLAQNIWLWWRWWWQWQDLLFQRGRRRQVWGDVKHHAPVRRWWGWAGQEQQEQLEQHQRWTRSSLPRGETGTICGDVKHHAQVRQC